MNKNLGRAYGNFLLLKALLNSEETELQHNKGVVLFAIMNNSSIHPSLLLYDDLPPEVTEDAMNKEINKRLIDRNDELHDDTVMEVAANLLSFVLNPFEKPHITKAVFDTDGEEICRQITYDIVATMIVAMSWITDSYSKFEPEYHAEDFIAFRPEYDWDYELFHDEVATTIQETDLLDIDHIVFCILNEMDSDQVFASHMEGLTLTLRTLGNKAAPDSVNMTLIRKTLANTRVIGVHMENNDIHILLEDDCGVESTIIVDKTSFALHGGQYAHELDD